MDWISIKDQVPEDGAIVITYFGELNNPIEIARYKNLKGTEDEVFGHNCFINKSGWLTDDVTHWMPLPDPPKV